MKRKILALKLRALVIPFCMICLLLYGHSSDAQVTKPAAVVHADQTGAPVHPYMYGMFTELLNNMYEKGMWAEMLSDRKFFYPVNSSATLVPENTRRGQNRWRPVGPDQVIVMDKSRAYVGEHSPSVKLDPSTAHGIQQAGIALRKGRAYTGRVILSGDPGAKVAVSLVWGPNPEDRQIIPVKTLTGNYIKIPLRFTAVTDNNNASLEITGTGSGTFRIGAVSLMPADNVKGFRADLMGLLKELHSKMFRWPGGNMVAGYDWRDGIGDPDKRPSRYDYAWRALESNDVGTDDYMNMCQILDLDPYICVNNGLGDAYAAAQWVEYANGSVNTPMGKLRAANGHPQSYNVKWWGIGNEMYGEWQLGHMSIEHYALKHNMFAVAMKKVDPTIKLIASGATPFETSTTARHHRPPLPAKLPYKYGSHEDWSYNLLVRSGDNIDYLAEHAYPFGGNAFNVDSQKFIPTPNEPLADRVRKTADRIHAMSEAWDEYLKRIPGLKDRNITYALDEWVGVGGRGTIEGAISVTEGFHEMLRHTDIITMGAYTSATGTLVFNATDATYSPVGLMFKLYRQHFGTIPVNISGNSPQHEQKGTVGVDKPVTRSGSDTYPLDAIAALSEDKTKLTLSIVNPTETDQEMDINFNGVNLNNDAKIWQIQAPLNVPNQAGQEPAVKIVESELRGVVPKTIKLSPTSITMYEFTVKK